MFRGLFAEAQENAGRPCELRPCLDDEAGGPALAARVRQGWLF